MHIVPSHAHRSGGNPLERLAALAAAGALAFSLSACNNTSTPDSGNLPVGSFATNPDTNLTFIVEANAGGLAPSLRVQQTYFGRLVRVVAAPVLGGPEEVIHENLVINPNDLGNGIDYEVRTNQITGDQTLVVYRDIANPTRLAEFQQIVRALSTQLRVVNDSGFVGQGAYTMVPRNASIVVQLSDLIDPTTVTDQSVKVLAGVPTAVPFEARVFVDPNHGDLADFNGDGRAEFYSTRLIIDPTVSETESFSTNPPLPVNTTGFPGSVAQQISNLQVRLATQRSTVSTDQIVQNPTEHGLAQSGNGSIDFGSPTRDIVRAARAGGNQNITGDPFNGYLRDNSPPRIIGSLDLQIDFAPQQVPGDPLRFILPQVTFVSSQCAKPLRHDDIISQPGLFARVDLGTPGASPLPVDGNGRANNIPVRLEVFPASWQGNPGLFVANGAAPAQYLVPFNREEDSSRLECFVEVSPAALGGANAPTTGVLPTATFTVRFNEPIDPASLSIFDSLAVTRIASPAEPVDYVPGTVARSVDLQEFTFTPERPLAHAQGTATPYFLRIETGTFAPTDLAGNPLAEPLLSLPTSGQGPQPVRMTVNTTSPSQQTGGRVIRFTGPDEETPRIGQVFNGQNIEEIRPEWAGQIVFDVGRQEIRPRPVTRLQLVGDRSQLLPGQMTQQPAGASLPLNTFGAKTQILYRYIDFGLPFKVDDRINANMDATLLNVDVEGVSLAPQSGGVIFESYARFRMKMAHSFFLPDEGIVPQPPFPPAYPASGLVDTFENNYLDIVADPPRVVHLDWRGYQIVPGNVFQTPSGTNMIPLPQNRGLTGSDRLTYTWRDTLLRRRAAPNGQGIYPLRWQQLAPGAFQEIFPGPGNPPAPGGVLLDCLDTACANSFYNAGNVQSSALPLLIEFDCFPSAGAQTQNLFDTSSAHPTAPTPFFRAFSAGGFDTSGNQVFVDPELEITANGGFNPGATPPGTGIPGRDNTYYVGALDLVIRVSRAASLFYPATNPLLSDNNPLTNDDPRYPNPVFFPAVVNPRPEDQPAGTSVQVRYRGASLIDPTHRSRTDARECDPYGDFYPDFREAALNVCDGSFSHNPVRCPGSGPPQEVPLENEGITFFNGTNWQTNIAELNGAQFIQIHLTFINNVTSGLSPSVSSVALSWGQ